jgi:hypothetical protein
MPFTPAHPLAVFPFVHWRRWLHLDATCLVIGSMAPDFEYFIHGEQKGEFGHTLLGIPLWGVPVTLILAAIFHAVVKWPLLVVAPRWIARRSIESAARPWPAKWSVATILTVVISAAIGDVSHIVWDGFTHANGFGERNFPTLGTMVHVPGLGDMVIFRVLQYVFSVIGLFAVVIWALLSLRRRTPRDLAPMPRLWPRVIFYGITIAGVALVMLRALRILHATDPGSVVVSAISGMLAGTLVATVLLHARGLALEQSFKADVG